MSLHQNELVNEELLSLHEEGKCKKGCTFCEEEEEFKFQEAHCKECLDSGYLTLGEYEEIEGRGKVLVGTITKKCPHCDFHDPYREQINEP